MLGYALINSCDPYRSVNNTAFSNFGNITVSPNNVYHSSTSGINPVSDVANVLLYPNPANNKLHLQITNASAAKQLHYKIYDILGRLIDTKQVNIDSNNELNIETLACGIYTISLQINNQQAVIKKFVKK